MDNWFRYYEFLNFFDHNCRFYEFILLHFRIITGLTHLLEEKHKCENEQIWKKGL